MFLLFNKSNNNLYALICQQGKILDLFTSDPDSRQKTKSINHLGQFSTLTSKNSSTSKIKPTKFLKINVVISG